MIHRNDATERTCALCDKPIVQHDFMADLFRESSAQDGRKAQLLWAHVSCLQHLAEQYLIKKRTRTNA